MKERRREERREKGVGGYIILLPNPVRFHHANAVHDRHKEVDKGDVIVTRLELNEARLTFLCEINLNCQ